LAFPKSEKACYCRLRLVCPKLSTTHMGLLQAKQKPLACQVLRFLVENNLLLKKKNFLVLIEKLKQNRLKFSRENVLFGISVSCLTPQQTTDIAAPCQYGLR